MTTTKETTALARRLDYLPEAPIAKIANLREAYDQVAAHANLITPVQHVDYIPQMHRVSLRAVVIDPAGADVYKPKFCEAYERAPGKTMILKLLQAAGGTVVESHRTDDGREQYVCDWQVRISVPQLDGTRVEYIGSKRVDYRDGSAQVASFTSNQLASARQFLHEMAETKALLRAVRGALALRQKYTLTELAKPFVVPALVPDPDMSDPEVRKMVAAQSLGIADKIYGPGTPKALPEGGKIIDVPRDHDNRPEPVRSLPPADRVVRMTEDDEREALHGTDDVDEALFGAPPAPPPPKDPVAQSAPVALCGCSCGHQLEVSEAVAQKTRELVGSIRCGECYPWGPKFDQKAHAELKDLEIAKFPKTSGVQAIAANIEWLKSRGGAR